MTDSLRKVGYSSRVPPGVRSSIAALDAGSARVAGRPAAPVSARGLLPRPDDQPSVIDRCLRARTLAVCAADSIRAQSGGSRGRVAASGPRVDDSRRGALPASAASSATAAWSACDAAWKARAFVNLRVGAHIKLPGSVGGVLGAAAREVPKANLPHIAEALVRRLDPHDSKGRMRVALALVHGFEDRRVALERSALLVAGLLRGVDDEPLAGSYLEFMACRVVRRHSQKDRSAFASSAYVDVHGLVDGMAALARGAGGAQAPAGRIERLLDGVARALRPMDGAAAAGSAVEPDDQALAIGTVCEALGRAAMPDALRNTVMAFLCDPHNGLTAAARAAMVYQFGMAIELWRATAQVQGEVLAAIGGAPGLSLAEVGAMVWAFGMHVLGEDPEDADWHEHGSDIVLASAAPADRLVEAVTRLAAGLPESCRQRVTAGLALASQMRAIATAVREAQEEEQDETDGERTEATVVSEVPAAHDAPLACEASGRAEADR